MSQFRNFHVISQLIVIKNKFFQILKTLEATKWSKEAKPKIKIINNNNNNNNNKNNNDNCATE